ncbi:MAG: hypothetical protein LUD27_04330 [Clostridia bacterium]|nr:hypothetical protein [Clostridia bacterium]
MNLKFLKRAELLKPALCEKIVKPDNTWRLLCGGEQALFDFGDHYTGYLTIDLSSKGSHQDAPVLLSIKFYEINDEIGEDTTNYNGWISKSWLQEELIHVDELPAKITLPRRYAFRYVLIKAEAMSSKHSLVIQDIYAKAVTSAPEKVAPAGETERERAIDKIAVKTLSECMQYEFEDGPKRDRRLWLGDLRLQALANYVTFKHNDLVKRCLYLFAGTADDDGNISACVFTSPKNEADDTFMFDYSLLFSAAVADYFEYTGDIATAKQLYPLALKQIRLASKRFKNNVIPDSDKLGWCFLDWNLYLNKQAGAQAVYIYCAKAVKKLAAALNKPCAWLDKQIKDKSEAAVKAFYDSEKGLFVSGKDRQISYAVNAWMCLAGVLTMEENAKVLSRLESVDAVKPVTPYMYHYYAEALIAAGEKDKARDIINNYWGAMADRGADTFYELFDPENPDVSPYGAKCVNSYCHAWSCTPAYLLRKYF